jgi:hypothetical protein
MVYTGPPSTRNAEPVVALACDDAAYTLRLASSQSASSMVQEPARTVEAEVVAQDVGVRTLRSSVRAWR